MLICLLIFVWICFTSGFLIRFFVFGLIVYWSSVICVMISDILIPVYCGFNYKKGSGQSHLDIVINNFHSSHVVAAEQRLCVHDNGFFRNTSLVFSISPSFYLYWMCTVLVPSDILPMIWFFVNVKTN